MTRLDIERLRRVDRAELLWRARAGLDVVIGRAFTTVRKPRWDRRELASRLSAAPELRMVRTALDGQRWLDAHNALGALWEQQPARFVISPSLRAELVARIRRRFPSASREATAAGDRLLSGRYDLLGYRDVAFDGRGWHTDVVHGRSAPLLFWSQVPYLDPRCGDHKVTWELNRHQHWIALGRAYWLSEDPRYRTECVRQLHTWLDANPPLIGINWASMLELGFRSLSWIWALNFFAADAAQDRSPWLVDLLLGLDRQLTQVERHLSYYFSPNTHLLGEALALYVAGRALPLLRASARREALGRRVLLQEISRQITADGGHCERSAHYHRYTLDFYVLALAVARITDDPAASLLERTCERLGAAARVLADDRGMLPLIGDDDGGSLLPIKHRRPDDVRDSLAMAAALTNRPDLLIGDPAEEVWWMLGNRRFEAALSRLDHAPPAPAPVSAALTATGYYVSRNERGDHLIIDGGPHGYRNGGHAHADALSITFTCRHRPLLIDTGTGSYTMYPEARDRFRSSALHNTLSVNGRSQSLPRGPFHWRHIANATTRRWRVNPRFDYFVGTHDGYSPLAHHRHVLMLHDDLLIVVDGVAHVPPSEPGSDGTTRMASGPDTRQRTFEAPGSGRAVDDVHHAAVHWHVDPAWTVAHGSEHATFSADDDTVELRVAGGTMEKYVADSASGLGWHAPVYGRIEPATTLRITTTCGAPLWIVSVFGLDRDNRIERVTVAPFPGAAAGAAYTAAVQVDRIRSVDRMVVTEPRNPERNLSWQAVDVESDARMLFMREIGSVVTSMALVDATFVRSDRYPGVQRNGGPTAAVFEESAASARDRKAS